MTDMSEVKCPKCGASGLVREKDLDGPFPLMVCNACGAIWVEGGNKQKKGGVK